MSEWKKVKLGDVVSIKSGLSYKSEFIGQGNNLLLGMGCVSYKENFLDSGVRPYSQDCDPKYLAAPGDLVLATRQQSDNLPILAMPAIIPDKYQGKKIIIGTNLYRVENNSDIENKFLFFVLKSHDYVNYIRGVKTGTTVQMVSKRNVEEYHFLCPPKETRKRIVSILSRYESLIDNYRKQIKLLEEAAQRLYKEWFVDLHFPDHENTKIVDGVPEGWEKKPVDSIYSIKYGKNLSTKLISESGEFPVYGANGVIGYYDKANCSEQVVLITSRGNGSGDVLMTYHKDAFITNNSFIVSPLEDYSYCLLPFTYQFLKNANFRAVRTGAAQPQLTNQSIHTVDVVLPSKDVIIDYCENISYNNRKIILLKNQIRLLTEARDRLLPKLMSGEIEFNFK